MKKAHQGVHHELPRSFCDELLRRYCRHRIRMDVACGSRRQLCGQERPQRYALVRVVAYLLAAGRICRGCTLAVQGGSSSDLVAALPELLANCEDRYLCLPVLPCRFDPKGGGREEGGRLATGRGFIRIYFCSGQCGSHGKWHGGEEIG